LYLRNASQGAGLLLLLVPHHAPCTSHLVPSRLQASWLPHPHRRVGWLLAVTTGVARDAVSVSVVVAVAVRRRL
jgi:hypothetical protein